jgi:hypothetical protein
MSAPHQGTCLRRGLSSILQLNVDHLDPAQVIQRYHTSAFSVSLSSLSAYLESIQEASSQHEDKETKLTDEEALCLSLEFIYRNGVRRPKFKVFIAPFSPLLPRFIVIPYCDQRLPKISP